MIKMSIIKRLTAIFKSSQANFFDKIMIQIPKEYVDLERIMVRFRNLIVYIVVDKNRESMFHVKMAAQNWYLLYKYTHNFMVITISAQYCLLFGDLKGHYTLLARFGRYFAPDKIMFACDDFPMSTDVF